MDEAKRQRLEVMKARLEELKKHDPSHGGGSVSFTPHGMPPELLREIEDLEDAIRALEAEEA